MPADTPSRHRATLAFIWRHVSDKWKSSIHSSFSYVIHQLLKQKYQLFSCCGDCPNYQKSQGSVFVFLLHSPLHIHPSASTRSRAWTYAHLESPPPLNPSFQFSRAGRSKASTPSAYQDILHRCSPRNPYSPDFMDVPGNLANLLIVAIKLQPFLLCVFPWYFVGGLQWDHFRVRVVVLGYRGTSKNWVFLLTELNWKLENLGWTLFFLGYEL